MDKDRSYVDEQIEQILPVVKQFAVDDLPRRQYYFYNKDVNDIATTPLSANRCIKVTIEYSDIPESESLEQMCSQITDENRPELVDFGKPVGKEVI